MKNISLHQWSGPNHQRATTLRKEFKEGFKLLLPEATTMDLFLILTCFKICISSMFYAFNVFPKRLFTPMTTPLSCIYKHEVAFTHVWHNVLSCHTYGFRHCLGILSKGKTYPHYLSSSKINPSNPISSK